MRNYRTHQEKGKKQNKYTRLNQRRMKMSKNEIKTQDFQQKNFNSETNKRSTKMMKKTLTLAMIALISTLSIGWTHPAEARANDNSQALFENEAQYLSNLPLEEERLVEVTPKPALPPSNATIQRASAHGTTVEMGTGSGSALDESSIISEDAWAPRVSDGEDGSYWAVCRIGGLNPGLHINRAIGDPALTAWANELNLYHLVLTHFHSPLI